MQPFRTHVILYPETEMPDWNLLTDCLITHQVTFKPVTFLKKMWGCGRLVDAGPPIEPARVSTAEIPILGLREPALREAAATRTQSARDGRSGGQSATRESPETANSLGALQREGSVSGARRGPPLPAFG